MTVETCVFKTCDAPDALWEHDSALEQFHSTGKDKRHAHHTAQRAIYRSRTWATLWRRCWSFIFSKRGSSTFCCAMERTCGETYETKVGEHNFRKLGHFRGGAKVVLNCSPQTTNTEELFFCWLHQEKLYWVTSLYFATNNDELTSAWYCHTHWH